MEQFQRRLILEKRVSNVAKEEGSQSTTKSYTCVEKINIIVIEVSKFIVMEK